MDRRPTLPRPLTSAAILCHVFHAPPSQQPCCSADRPRVPGVEKVTPRVQRGCYVVTHDQWLHGPCHSTGMLPRRANAPRLQGVSMSFSSFVYRSFSPAFLLLCPCPVYGVLTQYASTPTKLATSELFRVDEQARATCWFMACWDDDSTYRPLCLPSPDPCGEAPPPRYSSPVGCP